MRCEAHQKKYSDAKVISLGTGDATQPIASIVTSAMAEALPFGNFLVGLFRPGNQVSKIIEGGMDDSCDPEVETVASSHLPSQMVHSPPAFGSSPNLGQCMR